MALKVEPQNPRSFSSLPYWHNEAPWTLAKPPSKKRDEMATGDFVEFHHRLHNKKLRKTLVFLYIISNIVLLSLTLLL